MTSLRSLKIGDLGIGLPLMQLWVKHESQREKRAEVLPSHPRLVDIDSLPKQHRTARFIMLRFVPFLCHG